MRLIALCLMLAGCVGYQHRCDNLIYPEVTALYYQDSGEVVLKDTDYFRWKTYTDQLEGCVY